MAAAAATATANNTIAISSKIGRKLKPAVAKPRPPKTARVAAAPAAMVISDQEVEVANALYELANIMSKAAPAPPTPMSAPPEVVVAAAAMATAHPPSLAASQLSVRADHAPAAKVDGHRADQRLDGKRGGMGALEAGGGCGSGGKPRGPGGGSDFKTPPLEQKSRADGAAAVKASDRSAKLPALPARALDGRLTGSAAAASASRALSPQGGQPFAMQLEGNATAPKRKRPRARPRSEEEGVSLRGALAGGL
eukprot:SM003844S14614  [mRNA]  locus=s3844:74:1364:+ [translate_table: standard]